MATEQTDYSDDRELSDLAESLLEVVPRIVQIISAEAQAGGADRSVTLTQLRMLALLNRGRRLPSELARDLSVTPATVSETVDLLVRRGFVARGDQPQDRRQTPLTITEAGEERLQAARRRARSGLGRLIERLSPDERDALHTALAALSSALAERCAREGSADA